MSGFSLGGIFKSLINPATLMQLAMGPAGWASILAKAVVTAVVQQVIQQVGQQLGLPQSVINMGLSAFNAATGQAGAGAMSVKDVIANAAQELGMSALDQGQLTRSANNAQRQLLDSILESDEFKNAKAAGKGGTAGQSIFMIIATILGELADKKMGEMASLANQIGATTNGENANNITKLTGQMQGKGQEFGLISNAMTNVIKSVGEGVSTIARKG
jgi:hypothetical protein